LADVTVDRTRTSADAVSALPAAQLRSIKNFVEDVGFIRNRTRLLSADVAETDREVGELHHQAFAEQLDFKARQLAKRDPGEMLVELADRGFAWRDIARLIGVSVPAVRRWRQGESPTGSHLLDIARLTALVEILRIDCLIADVASWMEVPLASSAPLTGIDLAAGGQYEDLLDYAAEYVTGEEVLDNWQSDWRVRYQSEFEVFEAPDGELGIRSAGQGIS